jgi:hypothetical protein
VIMPPELSKLSHAEDYALILSPAEQLALARAGDARMAAPEACLDTLTWPPKAGQSIQATLAGSGAGSPANRDHLFVFVTNRDAPHVSERHLRPSVIFCKATNGFRCEWGAETYAARRSPVSAAKANRTAVLRFVLAANLPMETLAAVG